MDASVLSNLSYGMYAIGVKDSGRASACIVCGVTQLSRVHPKLAVSINTESYSCQCIKKEGIFTVSVLSQETPGAVIGALGLVSGRNTDKLRNIRHKILNEGVPVIKENTCCWFLCSVETAMEAGDQTIFTADIIAGSDRAVGAPMTYEYYRTVLRGRAPEASPVYLKPSVAPEKSSGEAFICSVCGYEYNDPDFSFEELPEDWCCPVCKVSKKAYVRKTGR